MQKLIENVSAALDVDTELAKVSIGHVLAFLEKELPDGAITEFLNNVAGAREIIDAASQPTAANASPLGSLLSGGLMGLATKLNAAGLDMGQIHKLGREIFGYAETIVGKEKVDEIARSIPGLSQFL